MNDKSENQVLSLPPSLSITSSNVYTYIYPAQKIDWKLLNIIIHNKNKNK